MAALLTVCSRNASVILVWASMLLSPHALATPTVRWLEYGCSGVSGGRALVADAETCISSGSLGTRHLNAETTAGISRDCFPKCSSRCARGSMRKVSRKHGARGRSCGSSWRPSVRLEMLFAEASRKHLPRNHCGRVRGSKMF